jgi:hypothetical protein
VGWIPVNITGSKVLGFGFLLEGVDEEACRMMWCEVDGISRTNREADLILMFRRIKVKPGLVCA